MSTAIGVRFVAGRYHALPWDRHVNEATIEWPPSPLRLLRALIAVWHRKGDHERFSEACLEKLVEALASELPVYRLPDAVLTHTRHFMPVRSGKNEKRALVFDAFLRVDAEDELVAAWPQMALKDDARALLAHLVERLGYLGRAESWTECRILEGWDGVANCAPEQAAEHWGLGRENHQPVELTAPMLPDDYRTWAREQVVRFGLQNPRLKKEKLLRATLPERFLDMLRIDTGEWRDAGWSTAPGTRDDPVVWLRPEGCFVPDRSAGVSPDRADKVNTVRLALLRRARDEGDRVRLGAPLPLMLDAIKIGEAVRAAAMSQAEDIPPEISGHDVPWDEPHQHAFYLPEDLDDDGRVDHLTIHAPAGLGSVALRALARIGRLWLDSDSEWTTVLEEYGLADAFPSHPYLPPARVWESVTPYLHPWHRKKTFTVEDQIVRELRARGIPEPDLVQLPTIHVGKRERRSVHFHRFRTRASGTASPTQPDTQGSFWRLTFPEPQPGPIALGFGCHFGLGIFGGVDR